MNIEKELEDIFDDPLLNLTERETELFDIPADMRRVVEQRNKADYVAQRRLCENFDDYRHLFQQVQQDLKHGRRSLVRLAKTENIAAGHFFVVSGQLVLLESMDDAMWTENVRGINARTRCVYENGTESNILLQTLRKSVMTDGYVVTETQESTERTFFSNDDLAVGDKVTGYIYVLRSLSDAPAVRNQPNLYKIGFSTNAVEERIANAEHEPTYLMAPVEVVATYKVVNMHSQKFEDLVHQVLKAVQFSVTVIDDQGMAHEPEEWFVVPLPVVDSIIARILDGTITAYSYNAEMQCLEKTIVRQASAFDTSGLKVLTLNILKRQFDEIMNGTKKTVSRELKQSALNKLTYVDDADGKRYLRRYDALRLYVGCRKNGESALVQVVDTTCHDGMVEYRIGMIIEHLGLL